jgi:carbon-monoxide dehydrogenase medium subunit
VRGPWETARELDELLVAVRCAPPAGAVAAYVKFGVHERPTLGVAVVLVLAGGDGAARVAGARIAIGCVNPRPARVPGAEARLRGCAVADLEDVAGTVAELVAASADPADDLHGSADYKRHLVAVFTRRAVRAAATRARGAEPATRYPYAVVA